MNNDAFFDGGIDETGTNCYLLPLTKTFFDYYTVDNLRGMVDTEGGKQKKMFEMKKLTTGVEVVLRIPIKKGIVEYQRNYFVNTAGNNSENKGGIIEKSFGLGVFPLVRCQQEAQSHFRVALFDKTNNDVYLDFFKGNNNVQVDRVMRRECRKRGIRHLKVVYSTEQPQRPLEDPTISCRTHCICPPGTRKCTVRRDIPGSTAFVPSVAGLIIAGEVVKDLCASSAVPDADQGWNS